jgi:hypothetical protein
MGSTVHVPCASPSCPQRVRAMRRAAPWLLLLPYTLWWCMSSPHNGSSALPQLCPMRSGSGRCNRSAHPPRRSWEGHAAERRDSLVAPWHGSGGPCETGTCSVSAERRDTTRAALRGVHLPAKATHVPQRGKAVQRISRLLVSPPCRVWRGHSGTRRHDSWCP